MGMSRTSSSKYEHQVYKLCGLVHGLVGFELVEKLGQVVGRLQLESLLAFLSRRRVR